MNALATPLAAADRRSWRTAAAALDGGGRYRFLLLLRFLLINGTGAMLLGAFWMQGWIDRILAAAAHLAAGATRGRLRFTFGRWRWRGLQAEVHARRQRGPVGHEAVLLALRRHPAGARERQQSCHRQRSDRHTSHHSLQRSREHTSAAFLAADGSG